MDARVGFDLPIIFLCLLTLSPPLHLTLFSSRRMAISIRGSAIGSSAFHHGLLREWSLSTSQFFSLVSTTRCSTFNIFLVLPKFSIFLPNLFNSYSSNLQLLGNLFGPNHSTLPSKFQLPYSLWKSGNAFEIPNLYWSSLFLASAISTNDRSSCSRIWNVITSTQSTSVTSSIR